MTTLFNSPSTRIPRSGDIPVWDAKLNQWVPKSPDAARVEPSGTVQTIANGSDTVVTWNSTPLVKYDTGSLWSATNLGFIVTHPGYYICSAIVVWSNSAVGARELYITTTSGNVIGQTDVQAAGAMAQLTSGALKLVQGDIVVCHVIQSSGGALTLLSTTGPGNFCINRIH